MAYTQAELKKMYEMQQTKEGQAAVRAKREMIREFSKVLNRPLKVDVVQTLTHAKTNEILQYFIAE